MAPPRASPVIPSRIRYAVLAVATANAFLLYLDRICMSAIVQSPAFQLEMALDKAHIGDVLSSFFFAYALGQLPAGWLADRFGPRRMLVCYILAWSFCTATTGFTGGLISLVVVRAACGLSEAGAYPASSLLITRWFPYLQRARANSVVAFGGRIGNALALWLTTLAIVALGSWRPVLWIYGLLGLALAFATHFVFRDFPAEHPQVNAAERDLIAAGAPPPGPPSPSSPWLALLRHPGLWMLNVSSVGINVGLTFIVTWLPTYLKEVRGVDQLTATRYVSIALLFSLCGMLFGGWWCDFLTRRFGKKWGRRLPFVFGGSVAILAFLSCPLLPGALSVAAACGLVAFANDSIVPAIWALGQDIGGKHVAATVGWSNMWGNFGASLVAKIIPTILATTFHFNDWREVFWLCAAGYAVSIGAAFFIDSTKQLSAAPPPPHGSGTHTR